MACTAQAGAAAEPAARRGCGGAARCRAARRGRRRARGPDPAHYATGRTRARRGSCGRDRGYGGQSKPSEGTACNGENGRRRRSPTRAAGWPSSRGPTAAWAWSRRGSSPARARAWCWPAEHSKGEAALRRDQAACPARTSSSSELDLASLDSVRAFAEWFGSARRPRPADQQRRRDGAAAPRDGQRLRASVRHQPPRPLRAHRAAARSSSVGGRPRGDAVKQRRTPEGRIDFDDLRASGGTSAGAPTASRSWRTCCSLSSSTGGCARPARPSRAWPPIPATPRRTCSRAARPGRPR